MTDLVYSNMSAQVRQLLELVVGEADSPAADDAVVSLSVSRGYDRKGHRTSRDVGAEPGPYSDGDEDTVVVEFAVHRDSGVYPRRGKGVFLPSDHQGPALRLRVELGPSEPLAEEFLAAAEQVVVESKKRQLAELDAQLERTRAEAEALRSSLGLTAQD